MQEEPVRNDGPVINELFESGKTAGRDLQIEHITISGNETPRDKGCYLGRNIIAKGNHKGFFAGTPIGLGYWVGVSSIFSKRTA